MTKAVILSVGGAPEPLITSLQHHHPRLVCFLASQQSIELVPRIKASVNFTFKDHKVLIQDINDLTHCYLQGLECSKWLEKERMFPVNVIVDFTGGTKVMSAALSLLAIARGYSLSYVGGAERNKTGLGTVITGAEHIFALANPWEILAIEDRKRVALMFNSFQFEAALKSIEVALEKTYKPELRRYLEALGWLCKAYSAWDKFNHEPAFQLLGKGWNHLNVYADISSDAGAADLAKQVKENLDFLKAFKEESKAFKTPCRHHLLDLLANAERRAAEGKYDDGVARLYRAIELMAQLQLKFYDIDAGSVCQETIPPSLRADFTMKYLDSETKGLRLPLQACYRLLDGLGDELGKRYSNREKKLRSLLTTRNSSILAHGFVPVQISTLNELRQEILNFADIKETELPVFPRYPLLLT